MKTIFICTDGTWSTILTSDRRGFSPTNVTKMARILKTTKDQLVYYDRGVGTGGFFDRILGGAGGHGLFKNVKQAYRFLVENYREGDRICIFGFSRGAYTARSLAGLVTAVGILRKKYLADIDSAFRLYRKPRKFGNILNDYRQNFCYPDNAVLFVGVWDTVGTLGIPVSGLRLLTAWRYKFHNTRLSPYVLNAYHAIALDEKRIPFRPTLWLAENLSKNQKVEQRWFPGTHSNIGGGYQDAGLSDTAFMWMLEKLKDTLHRAGQPLAVDNKYIRRHIHPDACAELRDSCTGLFWIYTLNPFIRKPLHPEYANQIIDASVYDRMRCKNRYYRPRNIPDKDLQAGQSKHRARKTGTPGEGHRR